MNSIIKDLLLTLPMITDHHSPSSKLYLLLKKIARREIEEAFSDQAGIERDFGPFGSLRFPYFKMGAVDSLNLFDLDELIIFSFYWMNRKRYRRVLDIGANIGLHSVVLDKGGFDVRSYEPDPIHYRMIEENIKRNSCKHVAVFNAAVSSKAGKMEFVRVLGNTTGSHLAGSKKNPYGDLERFPVEVEAISNLIPWADLIKLDAEGQEKEIILSTTKDHWLKTDAFVEIESAENAGAVFDHFKKLAINLFSQKNNWKQVNSVDDLPKSYHDGSLFVTSKENMPWNAG